mmetsp:Transcript_9518/g.38897  ORF Transcript_9518/g.38897 Transcript_9518/m.38897 type:complete len:316 (-) Transcript_9518:31-978(-)
MASLLGKLAGAPSVTVLTDKDLYRKGDTVKGVVVFKLASSRDVNVQVGLSCHALLYSGTDMVDKTAVNERVFCKGGPGEHVRMEKGEHRCSFEIFLMPELVPSFNVEVSKVSYSVVAKVGVARHLGGSGKTTISVAAEYDEDVEVELEEHVMSKRHSLAGIKQLGPIGLGELDLNVCCPTRIQAGETVELPIVLNNFSMKSARGVKYKLEVHSTIKGSSLKKTLLSSTVLLDKGTEECSGTINITFGLGLPPSINMKHLKLEYFLSFDVDVSLGDNANLTFPVNLVAADQSSRELPGFNNDDAAALTSYTCNFGL